MDHSCTARQCVLGEAAANEDFVASRCLIGFGREETRRFRRFDGTKYREGTAFLLTGKDGRYVKVLTTSEKQTSGFD